MKKTILIIFGIFAFLLISLVALPFIFKDKIIERIDREIDSSVNARVYYDLSKISLSVFKRFPHVSATIGDFGIIGNPPFQNDTLVHVDRLQVDFNLRSVIFGDYPTLSGIHLDGGSILVKVLEDGRANYDITFPSEEESTSESNVRIGIDLIEINDLDFIYDDRELKFFMALGAIDVLGRGDFTLDQYDLPISMNAVIASLSYEGTEYLSKKYFSGNTLVEVDMEQMKFGFRDGDFKLNDFGFDLDGFVALPEEAIEFDMTFGAKDNSFKSLLSLVPGMYSESFQGLKTSGTMDFKGNFKGLYDESRFPSFDITLAVNDGMFQYPDLPRPVSDVNIDMRILNETEDLANTSVNISKFNMNFGSNPLSGRFMLANLKTYDIDALLKGKLNLEELTSIFPIDGMTLRGILDVDAKAKGRYDSIREIIPTIDARFLLSNAYIKNQEYPAAIEELNVRATVLNPSGKMNDFEVDLSQFGFLLENEKLEGRLKIKDLNILNWDGALNGSIDLGKMLAIFPQEDMIAEGKIKADLSSKGSYKDVEEGRYNRLDNRGNLGIEKLFFSSLDFPQGIRIHEAKADFSPDRINLGKFDSRVGESPLQASGFLSNYMNYIFKENETLRGQLVLNSSKFNVNEWMTESESTESTELSVIELPKNIDFTMSMTAAEVLYDNLRLREVKGNMVLRDGVLRFSDASMKMLEGLVSMNGTYDPRNLLEPKFDFGLNINGLSIPRAFDAFNTVKAFAPIAQHTNGNFNSTLNFSGTLGQDMMPILSSLNAKGLFRITEASFNNPALVQSITSLTRLQDSDAWQFRNLNIPFEINNGIMDVRPFDVRLWDYQANVQGSTGFDGSINYLINMQVPAGKLGSQANALLATISGTQADASTLIPVALNLGGTYSSPKISLAGGNSMEALLTSALKSRVSAEKENLQEMVTQQYKAAEDSLKRELKAKSESLQDSLKRELEQRSTETRDKAVDEAKNLIRGVIGRPRQQPAKPDTTRNN